MRGLLLVILSFYNVVFRKVWCFYVYSTVDFYFKKNIFGCYSNDNGLPGKKNQY